MGSRGRRARAARNAERTRRPRIARQPRVGQLRAPVCLEIYSRQCRAPCASGRVGRLRRIAHRSRRSGPSTVGPLGPRNRSSSGVRERREERSVRTRPGKTFGGSSVRRCLRGVFGRARSVSVRAPSRVVHVPLRFSHSSLVRSLASHCLHREQGDAQITCPICSRDACTCARISAGTSQ